MLGCCAPGPCLAVWAISGTVWHMLVGALSKSSCLRDWVVSFLRDESVQTPPPCGPPLSQGQLPLFLPPYPLRCPGFSKGQGSTGAGVGRPAPPVQKGPCVLTLL